MCRRKYLNRVARKVENKFECDQNNTVTCKFVSYTGYPETTNVTDDNQSRINKYLFMNNLKKDHSEFGP